jgi:tRNA-specific 2-thiouridylase
LAKALFPIGHLQKSDVRDIAKSIDLVTAEKKDSQGLCFVGKISLPEFLQQKLKVKEGKIIEIPEDSFSFNDYKSIPVNDEHVVELATPFHFEEAMGSSVGTHIGAHYYTIGQRKGLHIGGRPMPSFVIGINTQTNTVYSGQTEQHPGLNRWALKIELNEQHWIQPSKKLSVGESEDYFVRIRYRQPLQKGKLIAKEDGLYILFEHIQRGITPGQFAAWYKNGELVGSGIISH